MRLDKISPNEDYKYTIRIESPMDKRNFDIYKECLSPDATRRVGIRIREVTGRLILKWII